MPNLDSFEQKLQNTISPNLTAKELVERIVVAALEAEFGRSFTITAGFAKMVDTLANSIVTNPELRRQALAVASTYNKKNYDRQKNIPKRD